MRKFIISQIASRFIWGSVSAFQVLQQSFKHACAWVWDRVREGGKLASDAYGIILGVDFNSSFGSTKWYIWKRIQLFRKSMKKKFIPILVKIRLFLY